MYIYHRIKEKSKPAKRKYKIHSIPQMTELRMEFCKTKKSQTIQIYNYGFNWVYPPENARNKTTVVTRNVATVITKDNIHPSLSDHFI